jgi:hypothetical protein
MAIKNYANLVAQLADNTTNDISPADVREIVESLSTRFAVATYTLVGNISTTGGVWVTAPIVNAFNTNGITVAANRVTIRDEGFYIAFFRASGTLTQGGFRLKLRENVATTPVDLGFSIFRAETSATDEFTLGGTYLISATAGQVFDMQYQTVANETWTNPEIFLTIISLPPKYTGA